MSPFDPTREEVEAANNILPYVIGFFVGVFFTELICILSHLN